MGAVGPGKCLQHFLSQEGEIEALLEIARQAEADIYSIEKACEIISSNLTDLSLENKSFALEALTVKGWLDNDNITIEGSIPTINITPINDSPVVSSLGYQNF